ncbi:hypothetical protein EDD15DRAFT_2364612 [Pisolithus albus]|nr:hypothetical protein EDD15DRAFT_2364612 [Pisolithus albus]
MALPSSASNLASYALCLKNLVSTSLTHTASSAKGVSIKRKYVGPHPGQGKRKPGVPHAGDKQKWPKNFPDDDNEIQIISAITAKHLGKITTLLCDLVTKVDNLADHKGKGKGKLGNVDKSADDRQNDSADEEDSPEWSGDKAD